MTFCKTGPTRWLGHLDLLRAFERAFRRCGLPMAYTQGHNPRQRIRFVFPSAVGMAVRADILFVDFARDPDDCRNGLAGWLQTLNDALPDGLHVDAAERVPYEQSKAELTAYSLAGYRVICHCPPHVGADAIREAIASLRQSGVITVPASSARGQREIALDRHLVDISVTETEPEVARVDIVVRFGQEGTIRPSDLMADLGRRLPGLVAEPPEWLYLAREEPASEAALGEESS